MKALDYMSIIEYNHHLWPTTWGRCKFDCGESARGSGMCVSCAEKGLAKIVGVKAAKEFTMLTARQHKLKCKVLDMERENANRDM